MNELYLCRLASSMYAVEDFPALDRYGSMIFERPIKGTWKLFRHITRMAVADIWKWNDDLERAGYPGKVHVPTFEEFATFMLHETTHGWCYFLKDGSSSQSYLNGLLDEEQVCWDVSVIICEMLGISYQEELANLCYRFHVLTVDEDIEGVEKILAKLPAYLQS